MTQVLKYWSKNTGVLIGSRLDQKIVGFLDRKNMGLVKWYTWPLKFLLRTGRYATALNDVERGRISSSLLFIPMLPPWPFSRHAVRSRKIREFSFIIPLTLDMRTHTNMDRFNPFLHTDVDQFNPLALTNLYYLQPPPAASSLRFAYRSMGLAQPRSRALWNWSCSFQQLKFSFSYLPY